VYKSSGRSCAIVRKFLKERYLVKIRKSEIDVEKQNARAMTNKILLIKR